MMHSIRTEYRQRAFDGKWERVEMFPDVDNSYTYKSENGSSITMIPEKWICTGVFDYELVLE